MAYPHSKNLSLLVYFLLFFGGEGGSVVLFHLNFFEYITSFMFKDGVSYNCLFLAYYFKWFLDDGHLPLVYL